MGYAESQRHIVDSMSQKRRQEILDLIWTGISVGDVAKKTDIHFEIVAQIIIDNIDDSKILSREAK